MKIIKIVAIILNIILLGIITTRIAPQAFDIAMEQLRFLLFFLTPTINIIILALSFKKRYMTATKAIAIVLNVILLCVIFGEVNPTAMRMAKEQIKFGFSAVTQIANVIILFVLFNKKLKPIPPTQ